MFGKKKEKILYLESEVQKLLHEKNKIQRENFSLKSDLSDKDKQCYDLSQELQVARKNIGKKDKKILDYQNDIKLKDSQIFEAEERLDKLSKKYRILISKTGGLTAENKKLKLKVNTLSEQLAESMTDKYLVKKLPAEKPKKQKVLGIKRGVVNSYAKQILREKGNTEDIVSD